MANALKRNIEVGEVVIMSREYYKGDDLRFRCTGGYGMKSFTGGNAVYGAFLDDGIDVRVEGWEIDRKATEEYQASEAAKGQA